MVSYNKNVSTILFTVTPTNKCEHSTVFVRLPLPYNVTSYNDSQRTNAT